MQDTIVIETPVVNVVTINGTEVITITDEQVQIITVGEQGPEGVQGIQGIPGEDGAQGIQGIQGPAGADGDAADIAAEIHTATEKTPLVDADELGFWDSVSLALRKITWTNFKATLKTYFDGLYLPLTGGTLTGGLTISSGLLQVKDSSSGSHRIATTNASNMLLLSTEAQANTGIYNVAGSFFWFMIGGGVRIGFDTNGYAINGAANFTKSGGATYMQLLSNQNVILTPTTGKVGIGTTAPDKQLEINSADGNCLRLTYNDANGSATYYVDLLVSAAGLLTINASGGIINTANDVEITDATKGLILKSPDGSRFRVTVSDLGALTTTEI